MTQTRFLFVRHGESTWNAEGRWQGQGDPPLTSLGRSQVVACALALLSEPPFALLVSSDLLRAAQTAEILGQRLGLAPHFDGRLRELDVGHWSGLTHAEISERWPEEYASYRAGDGSFRLGGGESFQMLAARVCEVLGELALEHCGQRILIVAHGGAFRSVVPGLKLENAQTYPYELDRSRAMSWARGEAKVDASTEFWTELDEVSRDDESL